LSKEQIFTIVEKCVEISHCRDLNNKLRGCLLNISTHSLSIDDFSRLFKLLANDPATGECATIDVKLFTHLLMRRNIKTAANLLNTSKIGEIRKHFEFFDFIYKKNPVAFNFVLSEIKMLLGRAQ
jgi:hypothetical protein